MYTVDGTAVLSLEIGLKVEFLPAGDFMVTVLACAELIAAVTWSCHDGCN